MTSFSLSVLAPLRVLFLRTLLISSFVRSFLRLFPLPVPPPLLLALLFPHLPLPRGLLVLLLPRSLLITFVGLRLWLPLLGMLLFLPFLKPRLGRPLLSSLPSGHCFLLLLGLA